MLGIMIFAQNTQVDSTTINGGFGVILFFLLAFLFYFMPAFVAFMRGHQNTAAITVLNLFLGWTFIGWVISLVWAFTSVEKINRQ